MNIVIITVGRIKEAYIKAGTDGYLKRLRPYLKIQVQEVEAESFDEKSREKARTNESAKISRFLEKKNSTSIFLLDEKGTEYSSIEFAGFIQQQPGQIIFVIGGALGFTQELKVKYPRISLSRMTIPHELARLVLLEQLYRSIAIIKGKTYHY